MQLKRSILLASPVVLYGLVACSPVATQSKIETLSVKRSEILLGKASIMPTITSAQANSSLSARDRTVYEYTIAQGLAGLVSGVPIVTSDSVAQFLANNDLLNDYTASMNNFYERGVISPSKFMLWSQKLGTRYLMIPLVYGLNGSTGYRNVGNVFIPTSSAAEISGQVLIIDGTTGQVVGNSSASVTAVTSGGWKNYSTGDILSNVARKINANFNKAMAD